MRSWDGRMQASSAAPTIAENSIRELRRLLLEPKLGSAPADPEKDDEVLSWKTYSWEMRSVWLENILLHRPKRWLPDKYPNYDELLAAAVDAAVNGPDAPKDLAAWRWGAFNAVEIQHPILGKIPVIRHWSGPGVQEQSGSGYTVKAVTRHHGPSERFTANLADLDQSTLNTVTGTGREFPEPVLHGSVEGVVRRDDVYFALQREGGGGSEGAPVGAGAGEVIGRQAAMSALLEYYLRVLHRSLPRRIQEVVVRHDRVTHCTPLIQRLLKAPLSQIFAQPAASGMERICITFLAINFRRSILLVSLGVTYGLLGCGGGSQNSSTSGTPVVAITATAGTGQTATVGAAFGTQLEATVTTNGSPASGMMVTFSAPASGASGTFAITPPSATATATTNSSGVATAPGFTAGTVTGTYTVTATVAEASTPANFSLINTAGTAATVTVGSGSGQTATVGATFGAQLVATVLDIDSTPVEGATVTFTAPSSSASGTFATTPPAATAISTTNSSGVATAPAFTADTRAVKPELFS